MAPTAHTRLQLRRDARDRRAADRRAASRVAHDRRRGDRRRSRFRTLLLAAATTLFAPYHAAMAPTPRPRVSVSMDDFRAVPAHQAYESLIQEAAIAYKLDAALIRAVMQTESAFNPFAVSRAGAQGLMQLMPALAAEMGVRDSFDPRENIMGGVRYLRELLDRHRGNVTLAVASYNAGPGAVDRYHAVPPFRETRRYVKAITGLIAHDHAESDSD
jgi:soluble lytic murein transglycosylase-like protein